MWKLPWHFTLSSFIPFTLSLNYCILILSRICIYCYVNVDKIFRKKTVSDHQTSIEWSLTPEPRWIYRAKLRKRKRNAWWVLSRLWWSDRCTWSPDDRRHPPQPRPRECSAPGSKCRRRQRWSGSRTAAAPQSRRAARGRGTARSGWVTAACVSTELSPEIERSQYLSIKRGEHRCHETYPTLIFLSFVTPNRYSTSSIIRTSIIADWKFMFSCVRMKIRVRRQFSRFKSSFSHYFRIFDF